MVIRSPDSDFPLDGVAAFQLARENAPRQLRQLLIAAEAQSDQIVVPQLRDPSPHVLGQNGRETETLFEPDDSILIAQAVDAQEKSGHGQSDRDEKVPSRPERRVANQHVECDENVDREDRNHEEMNWRMPSSMRSVVLLVHRVLLRKCSAAWRGSAAAPSSTPAP